MCNRYDSERAADQEANQLAWDNPDGCSPEMEFFLTASDIAEIEARRTGSALRRAAAEKVEIDVDTDVWEQEGGATL